MAAFTRTKYEQYFKNAAIHHADIGHTDEEPRFYFRHILDFAMDATMLCREYTLLLEDRQSQHGDNRAGYEYDNNQLAFMIVKHVEPGSSELVTPTIDGAEEIANQIVEKIVEDARCWIPSHNPPGEEFLFDAFDKNTIRKSEVHNLMDRNYGTRFSFQLKTEYTTTYDPAKWPSLP